jgi:hypothetical protein
VRHTIILRLLVLVCSPTLLLTACAQRGSTSSSSPSPDIDGSEEPSLACVHSDTGTHRLRVVAAPSGNDGRVVGIVRGTDHELIRNASVITLQPIGGGATLRARGDSSGQFVIANATPGSYELRIVSIGYLTSRDTIAVPRTGLSLDLTQVIMRFLDEEAVCGYLAAVDSEPPLTPARGVTTVATHELTGGSVQTTLTVRPRPDGATFDLLLRNVGSLPVNVTRLCYPSIVGSAVRRFARGVGPACYGTGMKLAPGDTIGLTQSVQLRGAPGDIALRVHAVDPPVLDAIVTLPMIRGRVPRRSQERSHQ